MEVLMSSWVKYVTTLERHKQGWKADVYNIEKKRRTKKKKKKECVRWVEIECEWVKEYNKAIDE